MTDYVDFSRSYFGRSHQSSRLTRKGAPVSHLAPGTRGMLRSHTADGRPVAKQVVEHNGQRLVVHWVVDDGAGWAAEVGPVKEQVAM